MSFLCGCFRGSSITHNETTAVTPGGRTNRNSNRIHIDPKQVGGVPKAWDESKVNYSSSKNILFLGLEGSGKTTLIHQLIEKKMILPPPSASIEQYKIVLNESPMIIVDVPGNTPTNVRDGLMSGLFAVVFVVDWCDELRRCSAIEDLRELCSTNEGVRGVPLLVVINKVDPTNVTPDTRSGSYGSNLKDKDGFSNIPQITSDSASSALGLEAMPHYSMDVVCCSAAAGWGIQEILLWLSEASNSEKRASPVPMQTEQPDQSILW